MELPMPPTSAVARPAPSPRPIAASTAQETVLVLDFGGQTAQLIARRLREAGVFSLLVSPATPAAQIASMKPRGIILSGGPASVYDQGAPRCDPAILGLGV